MKKLFIILLSIQMLFALNVKELKKGDIIEDSVERLEKKYYKVGIHNLKDIHITLTDLSANVHLYAKTETYDHARYNTPIEDAVPKIRRNDCYSSNNNREDEECRYRVVGPAPGTYDANVYIMVYGLEAGNYRLEVKEEEPEKIDLLSTNVLSGTVKKGEEKHYKFYGKAGETVKVSLFDLNADADLRLKVGRKANKHTFDCKSTNGGTKTDSCSVRLEESAYVYVHVDGYKSTDYSINRGSIDNSKNQALISKAKEQCLNQKNSTSKILCSNEENKVYIIESENQGYQLKHSFYNIDISENNEKVTFIRTYIQSGNAIGNANLYFPKQLEHTYMFLLNKQSPTVDSHGATFLMNPLGEQLLTFGHSEDYQEQAKLKTTENGKKLVAEEKEGRAIDNPKHTRKTYDISNPNIAILISEENI